MEDMTVPRDSSSRFTLSLGRDVLGVSSHPLAAMISHPRRATTFTCHYALVIILSLFQFLMGILLISELEVFNTA